MTKVVQWWPWKHKTNYNYYTPVVDLFHSINIVFPEQQISGNFYLHPQFPEYIIKNNCFGHTLSLHPIDPYKFPIKNPINWHINFNYVSLSKSM